MASTMGAATTNNTFTAMGRVASLPRMFLNARCLLRNGRAVLWGVPAPSSPWMQTVLRGLQSRVKNVPMGWEITLVGLPAPVRQ